MTDRVTYEVGWGPTGTLIDRIWVARRLAHIFDYRRRRVLGIFAEARHRA